MNINRDYLIINDVKKSNIKLDNGSMFFYITDKNTQNIFVNLVINISNNDLIQKYANIENAEDYTLTMNIVKPDNTYKIVEGKLHDKEKAIFEFNLNEDCCDEIGTYRCELLTKCNINNHEEITTSNKLTYKVKSSVLNDLDDIVEAPEYPLVIQLFDKLSDIEQYEEDRRANELARQLAEEQRQTRFDVLDADMSDRIEIIDDKLVEIDNVLISKEDIADIKAKNTEQDRRLDVAENRLDNINTNIENVLQPTVQRVDAVEAINATQNDRLDAIEVKNTQQDNRLDVAENRLANIGNDITNTMQPIIDEHTSRLEAIEAIDVSQNNRLDIIEAKNQQQDDRLLDIEKVNKKQEQDIKCLLNFHTVDITEEGNSIYLPNSAEGYCEIDNIQGNTLVNCNKEPDKEITLNGNINTQGYDNVTLTEGVDGGLVDVALEGNTMVNVCDQKDSVAITKSYTVEAGNHVALQGEYDGKCRPVVTGNTLVNLVAGDTYVNDRTWKWETKLNCIKEDTTYTILFELYNIVNNKDDIQLGISIENLASLSLIDIPFTEGFKTVTVTTRNSSSGIPLDINSTVNFCAWIPIAHGTTTYSIKNLVVLEGDYTNKPIPEYFEGLQSSFEDKVVTQEMVDRGEELAENLGKYRVDYKVTGKNKWNAEFLYKSSNDSLYCNSFVKIKGNTQYTLSSSLNYRYKIYQYDESYTIIEPLYEFINPNKPCKFTTNPKTKYIKAETYKTYNDPTVNFQIEEGSTATPYEPYKEYKKTFYLNSPLLEGDTIEQQGDNVVHVHRSELRPYQTDDELTLPTDKTNTLVAKAKPQYEVISQNDTILCDSYTNGHLDVDSVVPIDKVDFLPFSEELTYLYPSTSYTVQFISTRAILADYYLGGALLLSQNIVKGLNRISITTPSELVDNKLTINGNDTGANIMEVVVTDVNRELIYFEGMKSVGECEELQVISINSDKHLANTQQLTHEPLRGFGEVRDKYVLLDGNWYIERKCGIRTYQEGDEDNYKTDLINTVYPLDMPTYEEIDYNPLEVYSGTTRITTNSTIPPNIIVKNHGYNCLLKPSTTYTISSNLGLNTVTTGADIGDSCLRFMDTDTSDVTTMKDVLVLEGDWTTKPYAIPANFSGIESCFEQEYDTEKGKYKVNVKVANEDKSKENNITFYIDEPLRGIGDAKDKVFIKDDKVVVERNCGIRAYEDGDFGTYLTDKVNTVYPLAEPIYREVEYNDVKLFIESFKNSTLFYNSNVPVTSTVHYSYSVPIVDTVAQTANVTDQQDSMIIDLATQCAVMEMMLM